MASKIIEVADGVVALIDAAAVNGPSDDGALTAALRYAPAFELKDLETTKISVVPGRIAIARESRASHRHGYGVDVGIQRRAKTDEIIAEMLRVTEEIADAIRSGPITAATLGELNAVAIENDPIYSPEHLERQNVFLSVVRITYPRVRGAA